ncbi:MAG TPA: hypothetical protein VFX28_20510, partial [Methylomirabilota bacterium]|nr:hypothetical protein [Methylomirabilota bacterium]
PAVWNTVMVFYQVTLLVGYAYAHALSRRGARAWNLHLVLLVIGLCVLPLHLRPDQVPPAGGNPVLWLLLTMASTVALPVLLLSTTGPLIQRWFAHTGHAHARDPYFLYAASNIGSMLGLLAYPFLLEPRWALREQARGWAVAYVALLLLIAACALIARRGTTGATRASATAGAGDVPAEDATATAERITGRRRLHWLALAFAPSSLMLGATTHLSMDLVSVPLLWIVPLAVYLLTFILAFAGRPLVPSGVLARLRVFAAIGVTIVIVSHASEPLWFVAGLHLGALFALGLTCHQVLANDRPAVSHLTEFYMWVAAGGALGGAFNALVAPLVFRSVAEYPITLVLACLLAPSWSAATQASRRLPGREPRAADPVARRTPVAAKLREAMPALVLAATVAAVVLGARALGHAWRRPELVLLVAFLCFPLFAFRRRSLPFGLALGGLLLLPALGRDAERVTIHAERSFFGIHRVQTLTPAAGRAHRLVHGTTLHGVQWVEPPRCDEPLGYYHRTGPAGQVFEAFGRAPRARSIGVVGLGTGA